MWQPGNKCGNLTLHQLQLSQQLTSRPEMCQQVMHCNPEPLGAQGACARRPTADNDDGLPLLSPGHRVLSSGTDLSQPTLLLLSMALELLLLLVLLLPMALELLSLLALLSVLQGLCWLGCTVTIGDPRHLPRCAATMSAGRATASRGR